MTAREEELVVRDMQEKQEMLASRLRERRWADVAALVRFAQRDVPPALTMTDPALYRSLREGVTLFSLRGGGAEDVDNSTSSPMQKAYRERA